MSNLDVPNFLNHFKEEYFHSFLTIIEHFEKHPSASNTENKILKSYFLLKKTTPKEAVKGIRNLNLSKSFQMTDITIKVIKLNSDIIENFIYKNFEFRISQ